MTTIDATGSACGVCATPRRPGTRFCTRCGTPAPPEPARAPFGTMPTQRWAPPPGPPMPPPFLQPLPPSPEPPRSSRGLLVAIAVLAVLGLVLGTFLVVGLPWSATATSPAPTAVGPTDPVTPSATPLPADPSQALQAQRQADVSAAERLVGGWSPQLSAKREGMVVDGRTYDAAAILADHLALRRAHPDAVLVWSGDWTSFRGQNFWITLVGESFPTGEAANGWCATQGIGPDDCYAKRLSRTGDATGNTTMRGATDPVPAGQTPVVGWAGWAPGATGYGGVRPTELNANGDGTSVLSDITWDSWGGAQATGRGTASWVPPDGYSSDGVPRPAIVVATDLGDCHGRLGYRSVGWYFPTQGETSLPPGNGYEDICSS